MGVVSERSVGHDGARVTSSTMPATWRSSSSRRTSTYSGRIVLTSSGSASPTVRSHESVPRSTSTAASVAVMALVSEPMCQWSSTVTASS